ncbi:MAG TPA: hypothetical protein VK631_08085 [Solirubrobacteraceae bacterium]|nr:hypothetical protein [Solirubrobacteraceae bacterium]
MQRKRRLLVIGSAVAALAAAGTGTAIAVSGDDAREGRGTTGGAAAGPVFSHPTTIDNRYLPLTATRRCERRGRADDGTRERTVTTVLDRTRRFTIDGQQVDAAVIRDDAYEDGELVERTHDYFAQADDRTVYYLGEHVSNIRRGKVANHDGTWLYGRHTDVPGVAMPAEPKVGDQYRFEDVPGVTTESNRVEETGLRARVNGRLLTDIIRIQEFIQPQGEVEHKLYAPGVGLVVEYPPDGRTALVSCR